ncbi:arginase family protein [Fibrobacter sp.]|uniref:arginase family protein n=1 Tax=Fibrobacter sp. TaxID=35828 RepID=UPI003890962E
MPITVCNFTNVYENQPFIKGLWLSGEATWIDCTDIPGTDCYCDDEAVETIRKCIADAGITDARGIHFFDNGNYHYMSKIWTDMVQEPFSLVIFDHHPDMQEPRFGNILSCGGWVKKVLEENKFVNNVVIIGVADHLAEEIRKEIASHPADARNDNGAESNDKITFIRKSELPAVTLEGRSPDRVHSTFHIPHSSHLYLSIDKDALSPAYAATNWDQGSLDVATLKEIIAGLATSHKIIGIDICGERARDFAGDEYHTVQEADALNDRINRELVEFLQNL